MRLMSWKEAVRNRIRRLNGFCRIVPVQITEILEDRTLLSISSLFVAGELTGVQVRPENVEIAGFLRLEGPIGAAYGQDHLRRQPRTRQKTPFGGPESVSWPVGRLGTGHLGNVG